MQNNHSGIQAFRHSGIQAFRHSGIQAFRHSGILTTNQRGFLSRLGIFALLLIIAVIAIAFYLPYYRSTAIQGKLTEIFVSIDPCKRAIEERIQNPEPYTPQGWKKFRDTPDRFGCLESLQGKSFIKNGSVASTSERDGKITITLNKEFIDYFGLIDTGEDGLSLHIQPAHLPTAKTASITEIAEDFFEKTTPITPLAGDFFENSPNQLEGLPARLSGKNLNGAPINHYICQIYVYNPKPEAMRNLKKFCNQVLDGQWKNY